MNRDSFPPKRPWDSWGRFSLTVPEYFVENDFQAAASTTPLVASAESYEDLSNILREVRNERNEPTQQPLEEVIDLLTMNDDQKVMQVFAEMRSSRLLGV